MIDLRLTVLSAAVLAGAWHAGFIAGQRSKRAPSNDAQTRDAIAAYRRLGIGQATATTLLRNALLEQQKKTA